MKYAPLLDYLRAQPSARETVTLRFEDIEKILRDKLPQSATTYPEWWANQSYGSQAPGWLGAGFVVDRVEISRRVVRFRREAFARGKVKTREPKTRARKRQTPSRATSIQALLESGFKKYGVWELKDGRIHLRGTIPIEPGVYAHVVDGQVAYIGSATMGLKKRLYFYSRPGKTQLTSIRVNGLIHAALEAGKSVELVAALPESSSWNGLPVDFLTGLEAGLLKKFRPPWNKRGIAD